MSAPKTTADLLALLARDVRARHPQRPALIGVGGAQGSGKSYQCRAFAAQRPRIAHFSLDDVYLTRAEREELTARAHRLFITRGAPGTHDLALAERTIASLSAASETRIPRFDKRADDRALETDWPLYAGRPDVVLVDGWCMGALPLDAADAAPINALEAAEDREGVWRAHVLQRLADDYQRFFARFDARVYLRAPSFEIVRRWRGEQEEETLGRALTAEEERGLDRFVQHYERITRAMLAGRHRANWIVHLDESRNVLSIEERKN